MITGKIKRCMRCMRPLKEGEVCPFCGCDNQKMQTPPYCLRPGTCLNHRYYTGLILGEGGFGITYIGWDQTLSIPVAIKEYYPKGIIRRTAADRYAQGAYCYDDSYVQGAYQKGLNAFLQEAKNLARFNQLDGVAVVRDYFTENDTAYIVMDYIDGSSIEKYIKDQGKLSVEQVIKMLRPVMDTLQIMHENHMIHRDVSGDNLLVTRKGMAKLVDFGSARRMADGDKTITVMYKRGYAPEEQYRAKGEIGPWTDIYSICVVMYYMISGIMPEEATQRLLSDKTVPLASLDGIEITQEQSDAIEKGMAVLAENRFADMGQLLLALGEKPMAETELRDYILPEEPDSEERRDKGRVGKTAAEEPITTEMVYQELSSAHHNDPKKKLSGLLMAVIGAVLLVLIWVGASYALHRPPVEQGGVSVTETEPPALEETTVPSVTVTPEPEKVTGKMPKLTGLSAAKAQRKLKKAGFQKMKLRYQSVDNVKAGIVLKQSISAGKQVKYQKHIVLTISRKARPVVTAAPTQAPVVKRTGQSKGEGRTGKSAEKNTKTKKNVVGSLDALLDE